MALMRTVELRFGAVRHCWACEHPDCRKMPFTWEVLCVWASVLRGAGGKAL